MSYDMSQFFKMMLKLGIFDEEDAIFEPYDCLGEELMYDYEQRHSRGFTKNTDVSRISGGV